MKSALALISIAFLLFLLGSGIGIGIVQLSGSPTHNQKICIHENEECVARCETAPEDEFGRIPQCGDCCAKYDTITMSDEAYIEKNWFLWGVYGILTGYGFLALGSIFGKRRTYEERIGSPQSFGDL